MMDALILVDIQNDFLAGGALAVPRGDEVIPVANRLMPRFDLVVATQDWHPADHGSFASRHAGKKPGDVIDLSGVKQTLWPDHCVQGTPGAAFAPSLETARIHHVVRKGVDPAVDSYSGFFDNGRRRDTGLAEFLKSRGVTRVVIVGLATDYCVRATALDALSLGFETIVVREGVRGVDLAPGDSDRALAEMASAGARIISESELKIRPGGEPETLGGGRYLRLVRRGTWEYVTRVSGPNVVAVVPITDDGRVLLVEQHRVPVGRTCIEIPAGLVGDHGSPEGESMEAAARRELLEETGYEAERLIELAGGPTTPGLSDETMTFFLATRLRRVGAAVGDGHEEITLHEVPLAGLREWLEKMAAAGKAADVKVYAGLALAAKHEPRVIDALK